jgi:hypothetical protein
MLWADASLGERLSGLSGYLKLLVIPLLFAQFRGSTNARLVIFGFFVASVVLMFLSWLPTMIPSLSGLVWRKWPGVPVKDYLAQSGVFQLCAFALAYAAVEEWNYGRRRRAAVFACVGLLFFANIIYLVSARSTLVSMPIFILLFGFRLFRWRGLVAALLAGAVLVGFLWNFSTHFRGQLNTLATIWNSSDSTREKLRHINNETKFDPVSAAKESIELRKEFYRKSITIILNAPIMGHGTGSIQRQFTEAASGSTRLGVITTSNPHQQTFAVAIQLGLGGAALLWAMWIAHLRLFRGSGLMPWLGQIVVLQNILGSFFNSHLFDFTQGWIYVFGVGILGGAILREAKSGADTTRLRLPTLS